MNEASIASEEFFRITLQGITYTFRIVEELVNSSSRMGQVSDRNAMLGFLAGLQNQESQQPAHGQVKVEEMLKRGKGLAQFNLMEKDFPTFQSAAEEAGLLYAAVCMDKSHPEGERIYTLFCAKDDAFTINNIIELNNLNAVQGSELILEDAQPTQEAEQEAPSIPEDPSEVMSKEERIHQKNAVFMEQIYGKQAREAEPINPTSLETARKEEVQENQSAPVSKALDNTQKPPKDFGNRPSIKDKVEEIKRSQQPLSQEERQQNREAAIGRLLSQEQIGGTR